MKKYLIDEVRLEELLRLETNMAYHCIRSMEATNQDNKDYNDKQWSIAYNKKEEILKECEL